MKSPGSEFNLACDECEAPYDPKRKDWTYWFVCPATKAPDVNAQDAKAEGRVDACSPACRQNLVDIGLGPTRGDC